MIVNKSSAKLPRGVRHVREGGASASRRDIIRESGSSFLIIQRSFQRPVNRLEHCERKFLLMQANCLAHDTLTNNNKQTNSSEDLL